MYIGNIPADKYQTLEKQSFTTSATTTYTLNYPVSNPQDIALYINNVRQNPNSSYTVSNTALTLSSATTGTDVMYAVFLGKSVGTIAPATGSVTNNMLVNSGITLNGSAVSLGGSATVLGIFESQLLHIRDEKSSGTGAGTSSAGSWQTRTLNTIKTNEIASASLSSNQVSLPSGTYYIMAKGLHFDGDRHKIKLRNITDSSDEIIGSSEYAEDSSNGTTNSYLHGRFTIGGTKVFEIQHRCEVAGSFGVPSSFGVIEVYADVQIWKVA